MVFKLLPGFYIVSLPKMPLLNWSLPAPTTLELTKLVFKGLYAINELIYLLLTKKFTCSFPQVGRTA